MGFLQHAERRQKVSHRREWIDADLDQRAGRGPSRSSYRFGKSHFGRLPDSDLAQSRSAWQRLKTYPMRPLLHPTLVNGRFGDPALYIETLFEKRAIMFDLGDISNLSPRKI